MKREQGLARPFACAAILACVAAAFSSPSSFAGAIIHVNAQTGADANTGQDWTTAKQTVTAGLAAATSGDQVWVAAGTYFERITLKDGVALYGGFSGNETELPQRNWTANQTILDGNQGGRVVTSPAGAASTTRIDGFTIRNGRATYGAGIYCFASSPTIANNTVSRNQGSTYGGTIYCSSSSPMITGNAITGNGAEGIYCSASSPVITNNTITANGGAGIVCSSASSPVITNNTIVANQWRDGGGICCSSSSPTISNNVVAFNSSGMSNVGGMPLLRNNDVYNPGGYDYSGLSPATSDISTNPGLVATGYARFHLEDGSPCVDAGWSEAPGLAATDLDGEPRIQNGKVDIGADEFNGTPPPPVTSVVVRVSKVGNDTNDGSTWALAKRTIQAAIEAAVPRGGEIWAARGTYVERIALRPYVSVYGGFAGTEGLREERNWATNITTLDGSGAGTVVTAGMVGYAVSAIDGFTIRNGKATLSNGGGIYCVCSSPTIANNRITGNNGIVYGGGIACFSSSTTIANNTIEGNTASKGAGIVCHDSSLTISNNTIRDNAAEAYGGGIYCDGSSPTITKNTLTGNTATSSGGGIYCDASSPTIVGNAIKANHGAGIYCFSSSPTIADNVIVVNGGAGVSCHSASSPTITNNTIVANNMRQGGGIYCYSSSPTVANNLVAFNSSGIYNVGGIPLLRNNSVYNPASYDYSGLSPGTGDISTDPRLVSPEYGEVHLRNDSPCIDAGWNEAPELPATDMDAEPRIRNGTVDIGADECNATTPPAVTPLVVRVGVHGNDINDGSTWSAAKRTVQAGIDAAATRGGEVWVAAGTYVGGITLKAYVSVYGGFKATEAFRGERNWIANVTILDGNQAGHVVTAAAVGFNTSAIDGVTIRNGKASGGAGVYCWTCSLMIRNCLITGNAASYAGGGVLCAESSATITNSAIVGNTAPSGGGIYCIDSSPTIADNSVVGNTASGGYGGGIFCYNSSPTIANNTIAGNTTSPSMAQRPPYADGGGISCLSSFGTIVNNTIMGNTAYNGGGISCSSSSPTITNTIMALNSSGVYAGIRSSPTLSYNCVYGNTAYNFSGLVDPTGTNGNISADPLFVDSAAGDYHLKDASPCINAGDPAGDYAGQTDMDGDPRVAYGRVDIGADEFLYRGPLDFDLDNDIDITDFGFFVACFAGPNRPYPNVALCPQADFDHDADVDLADFGIFRACFNGPNRPPLCP